jgi:hypothetical protein
MGLPAQHDCLRRQRQVAIALGPLEGVSLESAPDLTADARVNPIDKMRAKTIDRLRGLPLSISQGLFCKPEPMPIAWALNG